MKKNARCAWSGKICEPFAIGPAKRSQNKKKQGKAGDDKIAQMKEVSARIKELDEQVKASQTRMHEFLSVIPNLPHESVPRRCR